jgi:hypothetical protein
VTIRIVKHVCTVGAVRTCEEKEEHTKKQEKRPVKTREEIADGRTGEAHKKQQSGKKK